jgi:hypothetical protein
LVLAMRFLWRLGFQLWFAIEVDRNTGVSNTAKSRTACILSNRALGVLIVRPGIWLDADPVKQRG